MPILCNDSVCTRQHSSMQQTPRSIESSRAAKILSTCLEYGLLLTNTTGGPPLDKARAVGVTNERPIIPHAAASLSDAASLRPQPATTTAHASTFGASCGQHQVTAATLGGLLVLYPYRLQLFISLLSRGKERSRLRELVLSSCATVPCRLTGGGPSERD